MKRAKLDDTRRTLKIPEAALIAGCGQRAIRKYLDDKTNPIPHLRFGRNIVIPKLSFLKWLDAAGGTGE